MSDHEREIKFMTCLRWENREVSDDFYYRLRDLADFDNLSCDNAFWNLITDGPHPDTK